LVVGDRLIPTVSNVQGVTCKGSQAAPLGYP
jgi:hypothetical protein